MSATTPASRKVSALLHLAGGQSNRVAAQAAEVSPSTVAGWKRNPVFASELAAVKALYEANPRDAQALLARLDEAEAKLRPNGPVVAEGGTVRVQVSIPAGLSPAKAERATAWAIARGLRVLREGRS
ncbi:hypothetical protein [Streptomyces canus]|uniref:hypothetical protein n=1 Tax=Streptomyces canus TaxID=58343 RepID=UPI00036A2E4A|nr:hypothetical protein [Streptomyces canus]